MTEKKKRGFALLTPERAFEIRSMGGKASPTNFKNNPELAKLAGIKGSLARKAK